MKQLEAINNKRITEFFENSDDKTPKIKLKNPKEESKYQQDSEDSDLSISSRELDNIISEDSECFQSEKLIDSTEAFTNEKYKTPRKKQKGRVIQKFWDINTSDTFKYKHKSPSSKIIKKITPRFF